MQPKTSIGSRIAWFILAALMLFGACLVSFRVLPVFKRVYAEMQMPLPGFTRVVFAAGPTVLVTMGVVAASLMVMGEYKPALRRIREPFGILVSVLMLSASAAMLMPRFKCGEIIDPRAPASLSQPTNTP